MLAPNLLIPPEMLRRCWFLCGPTAVGKSALSLQLAAALGGEILSLDSMAVFRGMDIGTAKPTRAEQQRAPHHLIDLVEPDSEFSTAEYLDAAAQTCEAVLARGAVPIFVGGTGLYLRAILRGLFDGPPADWELRRRLEAVVNVAGPESLHERLRGVDPVTAMRLAPADVRRVIRALEIHHLTGRPASDLHQQQPLPAAQRPRHVYWLHPPRQWLSARIDARVDAMLSAGWLAEVDALLASDHPPGRTARQALGYRELIAYRETSTGSPEPESLAQVVSVIKARTRQFAKRQHTWFRNLEECRELAITGDETAQELADRLLRE